MFIDQLKEIQDVFNDITTGLNSRSAQEIHVVLSNKSNEWDSKAFNDRSLDRSLWCV